MQIRTKTIIYKKQLSGSPNKIVKSSNPNDRKGSIGKSGGEAGRETFVYKKKNLNNENTRINKNNYFYSQIKKYKKIVNYNNKGKIINRESIHKYLDNPETITEGDGLCIRNNYFSYYDNKKRNRTHDDNLSFLTLYKRISMSFYLIYQKRINLKKVQKIK